MQSVKVTGLDRDSSVFLLPSRRAVEAASETTLFDGDVSDLELVLVLSASALRGSGSVAFTVEASADGESWSTVHSASVSSADEDVATVDAAAYVRVSADLGSLRSAVVSALAIVRSAAGAGGGSQPQRNVGQAEYTFTVAVPTTEAVQTWVFSDGDAAMLNLTDPTRPLPVVAGIYSVEVTYIRQPDSAAARIRLLTDDDYYSINTIFETATTAPSIAPVVAAPWFWSAGSAAQLFVADNGETSGAGRILVQKIA